MSVVWVTQDFSPIPTEPIVLADAIVRRALQHPEAGAAFAEVCHTIADNFSPKLLHAMAKAKHDRNSSGIEIDPETRQGIADSVAEWCNRWAGWSMRILGLAATEAMARIYGLERRRATQRDRSLVLELFGRETDSDLEVLLNLEKPRSEKALRATAEQKARDQLGLLSRQRIALDRWANIWWTARIDPNRAITIEQLADSENMARRTLLKELEPWDLAAGYTRIPGRPPKKQAAFQPIS